MHHPVFNFSFACANNFLWTYGRLMSEQKGHEVVRNVFGDSDEDEPAEYGGQDEIEQELHV